MDTVTTPHHNHCFWGSKHVVAANGTVALSGPFNTPMRVLNRDRQTDAACLRLISIMRRRRQPLLKSAGQSTYLAMEEVLSESLPNATDATIVAMIDAFLPVIVPELADVAIIPSSLLPASPAILCRWLSMPA